MAAPVQVVVPLPFALRSANAWLIPGSEPVLVDCGIGTDEAYAALREALARHGVAPGPRGPRILLTHGHMDHAGTAARLMRDLGATLHAAPEEAPYVATFRRDAARRNEVYAAALRAHGMPEETVRRVHARGVEMDAWHEDCPIAASLRAGDRVPTPQGDLLVHAAPGHTPGSLLYETEHGQLLTGDTLLPRITSNAIELADRDRGRYAQYLRTLDGLRRFAGLEGLPGHGDPFPITDGLLDAHAQRHEERSRRILGCLDRPKTAYQVVQEVLPHLAADQAFLGMCEVVGHLHALEDAHKVRRQDADGVRRFVALPS